MFFKRTRTQPISVCPLLMQAEQHVQEDYHVITESLDQSAHTYLSSPSNMTITFNFDEVYLNGQNGVERLQSFGEKIDDSLLPKLNKSQDRERRLNGSVRKGSGYFKNFHAYQELEEEELQEENVDKGKTVRVGHYWDLQQNIGKHDLQPRTPRMSNMSANEASSNQQSSIYGARPRTSSLYTLSEFLALPDEKQRGHIAPEKPENTENRQLIVVPMETHTPPKRETEDIMITFDSESLK